MIKLKTIKVNNLLTSTRIPGFDFVINPYIGCSHACKYCYACFIKKFTNRKEPWGEFVDAKLCDKPINLKKIENKRINLSSVTDAYLPYEAKYKITRKILEQLVNANCEISILTKSKLVTRDIDLFKQMKNIQVSFSINTTDEQFKNDMDKASSIQQRFEVLKQLHNNKIHNAIFISPLFPEITDWKNIILKSKSFVDEYWFENLNLRGSYKPTILKYIRQKYPQHIKLYEQIYLKKDNSYWKTLWNEIESFCNQQKVKYINFFYHEKIRKQ